MSKKNTFLLMVLLLIIGLTAGGTFAYWTWYSPENKSVVFNVADNVSKYIVYDEGLSYFIGDFQPKSSYCQGANTTLSFYKTTSEINFVATIYMDINSIGDNIAISDDVYWIVTTGDNTISCTSGLNGSEVVAHGVFSGRNYGDSIALVRNIEVTLTEKEYTVWIWIDSNGDNLSALSGETIDVNVWTQIDMLDPEGGTNIDNGGNTYTISFDTNGGEISTLYTEPGEHVYTVPETGTYKLELWGAQGGTGMKDGKASLEGGYGGYSVGKISLISGTTLYANVGGQGEAAKDQKNGSAGGYNGGGTGGVDSNYSSSGSNEPGSGGGGATHIATKSGLLSSLENNKNSILIVAGGGAGGGYSYTGGHGGGASGTIGTNGNGSSVPGTQNSGFGFGIGEDGASFAAGQSGSGGGYYGGASGTPASGTPGAGGSGYIGNSLLTNKVMYCYNCTTSSDVSSLTNTTTKVSETPVANYAKSGNGAIRITKVNDDIKVTNDSTYGTLPIPIREGYNFIEWNTQPDGNGTTITSATTVNLAANQTLYAVWELIDSEVEVVYLFSPNDKHTEITGGWEAGVSEGQGVFSIAPYIKPYSFSSTYYSIGETMNISWPAYSSSYNSAAFYATKKAISLNAYSSITVDLTTSGDMNRSYICVMLDKYTGPNVGQTTLTWKNCAAKKKIYSGDTSVTLNISTITSGNYHVVVGGASTKYTDEKKSSIKITSISMK